MSNEYAQLMESQAKSAGARLLAMCKRTQAHREAAEALLDQARELEKSALERYDQTKRDFTRLRVMRDDPTVLVRMFGPNSYVYHDAENPCGWVRDRTRYERRLWGEAAADGYSACSSCGWSVDQRAKKAAARRATQTAKAS